MKHAKKQGVDDQLPAAYGADVPKGLKMGSEPKPRPRRALGCYSDPKRFSQLDRRTKPVLAMEGLAIMLEAHLQGEPTRTQQLLIQATARIWYQLELVHARLIASPSDRAMEQFNALNRTYAKNLELLGLQSAPNPPLDLASYLEGRAK